MRRTFPPFILECELRKMGIPLRVRGDLILFRDHVTCLSCRVYFANKSRVGYLLKSPDSAYCFRKNTELLRELWPDADWDAIEAQCDILAFSDAVSAAMNICVDEDLSGYQYLGVQRLYGIYQAP